MIMSFSFYQASDYLIPCKTQLFVSVYYFSASDYPPPPPPVFNLKTCRKG